ncbi:hypothetical protein JW823_08855 [bacterium]|nr:hypothetical protein [candidate division CSSED10-310 bacterium]
MQNEFSPSPRDTLLSKFVLVLPFLIVAIIAGFLWAEWRNRPARPTEVTWTGALKENARIEREFNLVFPVMSGEWLTEKRIIRGFESERQEIQSCLEAFMVGPKDANNRLPGAERITVDGVYLDGRQGLIVDLKPLVHPLNLGGIQAEIAFIGALTQTVRINFPDLNWMIILVDGEMRETLAGHIDIRDPFLLNG